MSSTALIALLSLASGAQAQNVSAPITTVAPTPDQGSEIVVLGTRRTDRTLTNSASPVDVISATELATQPAANIMDSIKNIVPSFFVGQNTISDASTFVRAPSLRGLPSDEILVMINGKRFNRSALVQVYSGGDTGLAFGSQGSDISSIPSIAIKSLQILREGATAQYGSDAIGGVLNFGLRDARHGGEASARYGATYDGDGKSRQLAATIGVGLGSIGFIDVSGEYNKEGQTSRGATRPLAAIFAAQNPSLASQLPNYPGPVQIWGSPPSHGYKAVINSGIDVTPNSQLYFFGNIARSKADTSFNYRSPIGATVVDSMGVPRSLGANGSFTRLFYVTPCPTGNPTCPAGAFVNDANAFSFKSIYPAGFTPRFVGVTKQMYGVVGYKGKMDSGFTYDISASKAKNTLALSMYNSLNASYGPASQTSFQFGTLSQKETNANLDLTYPVNIGFASPLTVSAGAEYRKETYGATPGDLQSYSAGPFAVPQTFYNCVGTACTLGGTASAASPGASGYGGTSPTYAGSWSQSNYGVYGGLETDITDALSVGLAGRYEHYNTFGGAFVYKANALYKVVPGFSVRGTIGTGFHAPSPGQAHVAILTTNFVNGDQVQTGTYPVDSPISRYYGSTTLGPEKAKNYGVGFIAKPMRNLTVTVDGYIIKVKNRIGISQTFRVTAADIIAQPLLSAVGVGGDVNYFTNGYDTTTKGIDFVGTYRMGVYSPGDLNLTLAYNYNKSKVDRYDPGVISFAQLDLVSHLAPNHRATLSSVFTTGPVTLTLRENFYSWWRNQNDYPGDGGTLGQKFGSKFTTDIEAAYQLTRNIGLALGANNAFDAHPDRLHYSNASRLYPITGSTADGQIYPRSGGPFGINGGFWYAKVKISM
ncbi:TonB-dependent receptor plug domain-containing protein [Sphingomonas sp. RB1R13]|uniref:TonB-dependent receptor plug domain-containing protein n=1 Tax=Sphingomonas sp. RB1R13 TaxID=3096159 RepID=UPI002FCB8504